MKIFASTILVVLGGIGVSTLLLQIENEVLREIVYSFFGVILCYSLLRLVLKKAE